ncbi:hypothetical protein RD792_012235 [Penstemon davidsonii]|uniref:Sphingomyelin synthase-like domain-containing protein n=1 Tax=Penstemon davidsonii TaxID=160366 RepID=A0ABR0CWC0_9LAMI|nr:hypothetical protein RD792_012235 [Penstemon davidsonii]
MSPPLLSRRRLHRGSFGGLGLVAIAYVSIDYLSPWHERLQPILWAALAITAIIRVPFYKHWSVELRAAIPFILSMIFMLSALLVEMISVRSVTAVLGLDWHMATPPLPDVGQWLLLALNEKLPETVLDILRAHIIGLHHYLMLFIMLGFSVLFNSVEAPGLGLGARYMFTMGIGRLLRTIAFVSTILPSPRPWCASTRFHVPSYPHRWAQKYYVPYATDSNAIRHIIIQDEVYGFTGDHNVEFQPDWGSMNFLVDFLRPTAYEGSSQWYNLLKKGGGGCNDLMYSGHMLVAVLTAMAWTVARILRKMAPCSAVSSTPGIRIRVGYSYRTPFGEAYGGYSSALIWMLVLHSAQREIRERHHYTVDCIMAIYMGIFLWKMTGLFWPIKDTSRDKRLNKLEQIQSKLVQAAKDSDIDGVRELLEEVELSGQVSRGPGSRLMWLFAGATIFFTLVAVLLAFTLLSDG